MGQLQLLCADPGAGELCGFCDLNRAQPDRGGDASDEVERAGVPLHVEAGAEHDAVDLAVEEVVAAMVARTGAGIPIGLPLLCRTWGGKCHLRTSSAR